MYWNFIKKVLLILGGIASIVTIIAFILSTQSYKENKIKIECHTERMLSFGTKVDSLNVLYKGEEIDNVWKTRILLNNNGIQSIIGTGASSALLNDVLLINIDNNFQIISYDLSKNDFGAIFKQTGNTFTISFKKWKPNENMQIEVLLTSRNKNISPIISVNERDIVGANVILNNIDLAKIEETSNNLDWLINLKTNFPPFIFKIAKYIGLYFFIVFAFAPFYIIYETIKGWLDYSKWKKKNWRKFLKELELSQIPIEEKQKYKDKPFDIPKEYRLEFSNIPQYPDSFILFVFKTVLFIVLFGPLIVYAFFAWYNL